MAYPTLSVEFAPATRPTETPTWIDITTYVLSISTRRGRNDVMGPMGIGTCELLLDNTARVFDPIYALVVAAWDLKPLKRVRIRATHAGITYGIFAGYVDGWPQSWEDGVVPVVSLRACDALKILSLTELNEIYVQELSGARVRKVLADAGFTLGGTWVLDSLVDSVLGTTTVLGPYGSYVVCDGDSTLQAQTVANTTAMQYLNDITDSEYGLLFVNAGGLVEFRNRHYEFSSADLPIFGDAPGGINYSDYELAYDDLQIYNDVRMQRIGGALQTASDATSQLDYYIRTLRQDALLITTDIEAADRANFLLNTHKAPSYRGSGITLTGYGDADQMLQMVALDIGDRIVVKRRPQGGLSLTIRYRIEGIEQRIGERGLDWQTRYLLSVDTSHNIWLLAGATGDEWAAQSVLGTTTILSY